jgi:hypothetical protein
MSRSVALAIHLGLITLGAADQYLLPAFSHLNAMQLTAVTAFLAVIFQAYQMVIGLQAYDLTPSGDKAGQSIVSTLRGPGGTLAGVVETHSEPQK